MTKSQEIREEQRKASEARPLIIDELRDGNELLEIASTVAARWEIDERKAYRWAQYVSEEFGALKKRWVTVGLVILWLGVLIALTGAALSVFTTIVFFARPWVVGLAVGTPVAVIGAAIIARSSRLVRLSE